MEAPKLLLAKKAKEPGNPQYHETLVGHSQRVVESFIQLFGQVKKPTRLAESWARFFNLELNDIDSRHAFFINGLFACGVHDIGKANSGFQEAVQPHPGRQVIRHEHLSGLILFMHLYDWMKGMEHLERDVAICAVIGHHLKASHESFAEPVSADHHVFTVCSSGIMDVINHCAKQFPIKALAKPNIPERWSVNSTEFIKWRDDFKRKYYLFDRELRSNNAKSRLLIAVRAALIAADSAGSGLMREGKSIKEWIGGAFSESEILDGSAIERKVIVPRIDQLQKLPKERKWRDWRDWQKAMDDLSERALLLSSCGSGKTLAAWRWIKAQAARHPVARVIFLYPTRGTSTEGFRDYVSWAPESDAALLHGTAAYELQGMFENPQDSRQGKDYTTEDRLFALAYWQRRIFSATIDQFLGFMQHAYRSMCLLPLLADSVVVLDEVHSFNQPLFSALRHFLENFNVPVLCMTASLPVRRQKELQEECKLMLFPQDAGRFSELQAVSDMPRYQVQTLQSEKSALAKARNAAKAGKKVLWVVNTVKRCQKLAKEMNALCYHSRFTLDDRKEKHRNVIDAFQKGNTPVLALTTQVCEMSLDLDAEVLISETAPITALIQRMGRCNRHARPGQKKIGKVYIYQPKDEKPYQKEDISGANVKAFLKDLLKKTTSQTKLSELLEKYGSDEVEVKKYAAFLEDGPWAESRENLRGEAEDFTTPAILDCDIDRYLSMKNKREGLIVPVPRRMAKHDSRLGSWLGVAESSHYDKRYGFSDMPWEVGS